jgi:hypothetical protein
MSALRIGKPITCGWDQSIAINFYFIKYAKTKLEFLFLKNWKRRWLTWITATKKGRNESQGIETGPDSSSQCLDMRSYLLLCKEWNLGLVKSKTDLGYKVLKYGSDDKGT